MSGSSPLSIMGLGAGTQIAKGDYVAVAIKDNQKSDSVDIPAFNVKPAED